MNIKRSREALSRDGAVEFKLDSKSKETREKLSGKELKKEVEKDIKLIDRHRLIRW